jgi:uncharacterized Ntn-hydrolase superfamily protein
MEPDDCIEGGGFSEQYCMNAGRVLPAGYTATFSITAYDAASDSWGVAVQSKFLAVGSLVPWACAGVGAIATQALANPRFGPLGLAMLKQGISAAETVAALVASDGGRQMRQVGAVDGTGTAAAYTGEECFPWAGHVTGEGFSCQGNILTGPEVVEEMRRAYGTDADLPFADRLITVLAAGQSAGGDSRGQQSAALLIVRAGGGFGGYSDRAIDLRVDDHPAPIDELRRLLHLHRELFQ